MSGEINLKIDFPDKEKLKKQLKNNEKALGTAMKRTISDFKSRAPGWVASCVTEKYTVKKADVRNSLKAKVKAGAVKIAGVTVDGMALKYSGGLLTPTHFQMTPKAKPEGGRRYTVKAKIKKDGPKKTLSSRAFLAPVSGEGSTQIPFQRKGSSRLPVEAIKTLSVPQMIENDKVSSEIQKRIEEGLSKRMEHNMEQAVKSSS